MIKIDNKFKVVYRGITLNCEEVSTDNNGQRTVIHQFALNQNHVVEQLGLDARTIQLNITVSGDSWREEKAKIMGALRKPGAGLMIHPELGNITVSAQAGITETENYVSGRYTCTITASFVEWKRDTLTASSKVNTQSKLISSIGKCRALIQKAVDVVYTIQALPFAALDFIGNQFENTIGLSPFKAAGIVQLGADILGGGVFASNALWQYNAMLNRITASVKSYANNDDSLTETIKPEDAASGLLSMAKGIANYQVKNQVSGTNATKTKLSLASDVMAVCNRSQTLLALMEVSAYIDYVARPDITQITSDIADAVNALLYDVSTGYLSMAHPEMDEINNTVYRELSLTLGFFLADTNQRLPSVPDVYTINITTPTSPLLLSSMAYGSISYAEEIQTRNNQRGLGMFGAIEFIDYGN